MSGHVCLLASAMRLQVAVVSWRWYWQILYGASAFVYLDDIVAFGKDFSIPCWNLRVVFEWLQRANLKFEAQDVHTVRCVSGVLGARGGPIWDSTKQEQGASAAQLGDAQKPQ